MSAFRAREVRAMTITIPVWLLWTLGGLGVLVLLVLAFLGCVFIYTFKDFGGWR